MESIKEIESRGCRAQGRSTKNREAHRVGYFTIRESSWFWGSQGGWPTMSFTYYKWYPRIMRNATHHEIMHVDLYPWWSPSTSFECEIRQRQGRLACITRWVSCKGCRLFSSAGNLWSITIQDTQFKKQQYGNTNSILVKFCWSGTQKSPASDKQANKLAKSILPSEACRQKTHNKLQILSLKTHAFCLLTCQQCNNPVNIFLLLEHSGNMFS